LAVAGRGCSRASLLAVVFLLCVSCSQPHGQETSRYTGPPLAAPERIIVLDFVTAQQGVQLDQGISARLLRAVSNESTPEEQRDAAWATANGLADELVSHIRSLGLPVERASSLRERLGSGRIVVVEGQIVSVDEGNRTRRTMIGLGAGQSSVTANAQLYYISGRARPQLLESFQASADSGHAPGMAETMGAGAVAGRLGASAAGGGAMHGVLEARHADSVDEGKSVGRVLARMLGPFFVQQGWASAAAR
jgi:hypothetical protein